MKRSEIIGYHMYYEEKPPIGSVMAVHFMHGEYAICQYLGDNFWRNVVTGVASWSELVSWFNEFTTGEEFKKNMPGAKIIPLDEIEEFRNHLSKRLKMP